MANEKNHPSKEKKKIEDQEENQKKWHNFQEERESNTIP